MTTMPKASNSAPPKAPRRSRRPASAAALAAVQQHKFSGRRGDIRMHKAVAARMADPSISLFEALKLGGFDYLNDESATAVDGDNVGLGQRKNQLSRRLRLVKKQVASAKKKNGKNDEAADDGLLNEKFESGLKKSNDDDDGIIHSEASTNGASVIESTFPPPFTAQKELGNHRTAHNRCHQQPTTPPLAVEAASTAQQRLYDGTTIGSTCMEEHPSGSAIASLKASAQTVGLTFEQLAETFSSNRPSLSKVVLEANCTHCQAMGDTKKCPKTQKNERTALQLHQIESKGLYEKALVMAGCDLKDYNQNSHSHLNFCLRAWQKEGQRLCKLIQKCHPEWKKVPEWKKGRKGDAASGGGHKPKSDRKRTNESKESRKKKLSKQSHCLNHGGLHIHRLDGQFGQQRHVLHNPKDGVPHIDFVMGGMVECYHGVDSNRRPSKMKLKAPPNVKNWQSKFAYDEGGLDAGRANPEDGGLIDDDLNDAMDGLPMPPPLSSLNGGITPCALAAPEPRMIPISDIKQNDPEWNFDPDDSIDDMLTGFMLMQNDTAQI